jgi:hypothetical protein
MNIPLHGKNLYAVLCIALVLKQCKCTGHLQQQIKAVLNSIDIFIEKYDSFAQNICR